MKEKVLLRSRKWLNPPASDDTGAISSVVTVDTFVKDSKYVDGSIEIRDCGRSITLSFYALTPSALQRKIKKANLLIDEITKFRDALIEAEKLM